LPSLVNSALGLIGDRVSTLAKSIATLILSFVFVGCELSLSSSIQNRHSTPHGTNNGLIGIVLFFTYILAVRFIWRDRNAPIAASSQVEQQPNPVEAADPSQSQEVPSAAPTGDGRDSEFRAWLEQNGYTDQALPPDKLFALREQFESQFGT
jgi:preprotein translocase subunit SecG